MKKVSCSAAGGPAECTHVIEAEDFDGFMKQAHEHFGGMHADMIKDVSDEDKKKWSDNAKKVFDETAEA